MIYAYGDSFIADGKYYKYHDRVEYYHGWTEILAKNCQLNLTNKGVDGGSTEYSMLCFTEDIKHNVFKSNDIILFLTSTPGRIHLEYQRQRPETASQYKYSLQTIDKNDPNHVWYFENEKYLTWYTKNSDISLDLLNHMCYTHAIINFAISRPDLKVVLLSNTFYPGSIKHPPTPSNCLVIPLELFKISKNEYVNDYSYIEWTKYSKFDMRVNHMGIGNLYKFANLLEESLNTGRTDNFTYDKFDQKIFDIIKTSDDYYKYVNANMIYDLNTGWNPFRKK